MVAQIAVLQAAVAVVALCGGLVEFIYDCAAEPECAFRPQNVPNGVLCFVNFVVGVRVRLPASGCRMALVRVCCV